MKKAKDSGRFLEEMSVTTPAESGSITLPTFKKGMKVRLSSSACLHQAYRVVVCRFSKGEIGEVLGQHEQDLVVCFKGENWVVSSDKLRPLKEGATQRKKRS